MISPPTFAERGDSGLVTETSSVHLTRFLGYAVHTSLADMEVSRQRKRSPNAPNHALQRTATAVTARASAAAFPPAMHGPRQPPPSLSLGSLGVIPVRVLLSLSIFAITGCASRSVFYGPPESQAWFRHALSRPTEHPSYKQFSDAYRGDAVALRAYFAEALRLCQSSEIYVEPGETLSWTLQTILHRIGDTRFASVLASEPPRTQAAVGDFLPRQVLVSYPTTRNLLTRAPKIDFPLNKAYRR